MRPCNDLGKSKHCSLTPFPIQFFADMCAKFFVTCNIFARSSYMGSTQLNGWLLTNIDNCAKDHVLSIIKSSFYHITNFHAQNDRPLSPINFGPEVKGIIPSVSKLAECDALLFIDLR